MLHTTPKWIPLFASVLQSVTYFPWPTHRTDAPNPLIIPAIIMSTHTMVFEVSLLPMYRVSSPAVNQQAYQNDPRHIDFLAPNFSIMGADKKLQIANVKYSAASE